MEIRRMMQEDAQQVLEMMRVFYRSPAVHTNGSEEIFQRDIETCVQENPYLEGYVFVQEDRILGYAMVAKSFSTEFGKPCIWLEDLYVREGYRDRGIGRDFLQYLEENYPYGVLRLEVEAENERAVHVYRKNGYQVLPYLEMIKGH